MGLFDIFKKKAPAPAADEGERYYRMALSDADHRHEYLQKGAELGSRHAMASLARYYIEEYPYCYNEEYLNKAVRLFEDAKAKGAMINHELLARAYEGLHQPENAMDNYLIAAENGGKQAMLVVAEGYMIGTRLPKDYAKARSLLEKAIAAGVPDAYNSMGRIYQYGLGVDKDLSKAVEYFTKGAESGSIPACGNLAKCYYEGLGIRTDYGKAYEYAKRGLKEDDIYSRCVYALLLFYGNGISQDRYEAEKQFKSIRNSGDSWVNESLEECQRVLDKEAQELYDIGKGDPESPFLHKAADLGHPQACLELLNDAAKKAVIAAESGISALGNYDLYSHLTMYYDTVDKKLVYNAFPRADFDKILVLLALEGRQLLSQKNFSAAISLMRGVYKYQNLLCMHILAHAYNQDGQNYDAKKVIEDILEHRDISNEEYRWLFEEATENRNRIRDWQIHGKM